MRAIRSFVHSCIHGPAQGFLLSMVMILAIAVGASARSGSHDDAETRGGHPGRGPVVSLPRVHPGDGWLSSVPPGVPGPGVSGPFDDAPGQEPGDPGAPGDGGGEDDPPPADPAEPPETDPPADPVDTEPGGRPDPAKPGDRPEPADPQEPPGDPATGGATTQQPPADSRGAGDEPPTS